MSNRSKSPAPMRRQPSGPLPRVSRGEGWGEGTGVELRRSHIRRHFAPKPNNLKSQNSNSRSAGSASADADRVMQPAQTASAKADPTTEEMVGQIFLSARKLTCQARQTCAIPWLPAGRHECLPHQHARTLLASILIILLCLFTPGCAIHHAPRESAVNLSPVKVEHWTFDGEPGRRVTTPHYVVYATVTNDDFLESIGQLMEGALAEYRRLAPDVLESDQPMECYLFATRPQWAKFTREKTGEDAAVYLQINRGGYTVRDWFVAYFLGDVGTFCVAAHEGFHQYAARHFKARIPPFLEEGIACLFEDA